MIVVYDCWLAYDLRSFVVFVLFGCFALVVFELLVLLVELLGLIYVGLIVG